MFRGDRLRDLRLEKKLSQTELAKRVCTTSQNIYKYEKGLVKEVPYKKMYALAKELDTNVFYLEGTSDRKAGFPPNDLFHTEFDLPPDDMKMLLAYRQLNKNAQNRVIEYCNDLLCNPQNLNPSILLKPIPYPDVYEDIPEDVLDLIIEFNKSSQSEETNTEVFEGAYEKILKDYNLMEEFDKK